MEIVGQIRIKVARQTKIRKEYGIWDKRREMVEGKGEKEIDREEGAGVCF